MSGLQNWNRRISNSLEHALLGRALQPWIPEGNRGEIILEARLYLLAYVLAFAASVALHPLALMWLWIVPGMIGQFFLRNDLLAEHTGCALRSDMLEMTRTIHTNPAGPDGSISTGNRVSTRGSGERWQHFPVRRAAYSGRSPGSANRSRVVQYRLPQRRPTSSL